MESLATLTPAQLAIADDYLNSRTITPSQKKMLLEILPKTYAVCCADRPNPPRSRQSTPMKIHIWPGSKNIKRWASTYDKTWDDLAITALTALGSDSSSPATIAKFKGSR